MSLNKPLTRSTSSSSPSLSANGSNVKQQSQQRNINDVESLSDLWGKIQAMFAQSKTDIEDKIDSCKADLEKKIDGVEQKLSDLRLDCGTEINKIAGVVSDMQSDLDRTKRSVARLESSHELIVSGIPFTNDEDLLIIFQNIATTLAYTASTMPMVHVKRLSKLPISVGSTPPLLIQFALRNIRDEFYGRYLRERSLTLRHIGFSNDNRVYMNENLSQADREIRSQAVKLKRQGRIHQVYTRNGTVYVRIKRTQDDAEPLHSLEQLFSYVN